MQGSGQSNPATSEAPAPHASRRYVVLAVLLVVYCLNYMDRQILGILALPIKEELKLTDTQLGLMGGLAFAIFYSVLGIPIARLADRYHRVSIVSTALGLWSLCTALCGFANNFAQFFVARLCVGIGEAGGVAPTYSILSDYFPPHQRARVMAVLTLGLPLGSGLGLLIGGLLAAQYGWRSAFFVLGFGGLLVVPLTLLLVKEPPRGGAPTSATQPAAARQSFADVVRLMGVKRSFWLFSLGAATASMLSYGLQFWLPAFVHRSLDLSFADTALYLAIATIVGGVAGTLLGGWLSDRLGARHKAAYGWVPAVAFASAMPFLLAAMTIGSSWGILMLLTVPLGMGLVWTGPTIGAIQNLAPPTMRATASALFLCIVNFIGLGLGTVLFGLLSDGLQAHFGSDALRYSIITCAVVLYPLTIILFVLAGRHLHADGEPSDSR
ncbi:MFS transporter [Sphingomonas koreensis]|uniref:MFS transporter n=2 Tax=Sphingomonas koreensis TaxID=93064 RepID=A0A430G1Z3_9SPHN|nr:MFS transporter [Sphingomonas koreensis]RSY82023.1 MFS transporter [Sphingomonas koreensis]